MRKLLTKKTQPNKKIKTKQFWRLSFKTSIQNLVFFPSIGPKKVPGTIPGKLLHSNNVIKTVQAYLPTVKWRFVGAGEMNCWTERGSVIEKPAQRLKHLNTKSWEKIWSKMNTVITRNSYFCVTPKNHRLMSVSWKY